MCIAGKTGMKRSKKLIAVTGGIGSGKSAVLEHLRGLGFAVLSADAIARRIYEDKRVLRQVREAFPNCVCEGVVDRKKLAGAVFSDVRARQKLEAITHPAIMDRLFTQACSCAGDVVFAEVPLLFEGGYERLFDGVIVVMRPLASRVAAVIGRDGLTEQEVLARVQNQWDYEKNPPKGHTVLYNDGDLAALYKQTERILHEEFSIDIS